MLNGTNSLWFDMHHSPSWSVWQTSTNHLNYIGKATNMGVEKKLFQKTVEVLSKVWNKTFIYRFPLDYICLPIGKKYVASSPDSVLKRKQSCYCLQNVKLQSTSYCLPFESNFAQSIRQRLFIISGNLKVLLLWNC